MNEHTKPTAAVPANMLQAEWDARVDLAAIYRLLGRPARGKAGARRFHLEPPRGRFCAADEGGAAAGKIVAAYEGECRR